MGTGRAELCASALQLLCFEDDEVLVEGLQGGVGEAGGTVEDGSSDEHHIEPFNEGAAGKAVEDCLLMETALVKVL